MDQPRPAPSCALIVFGAGGDLFKRLIERGPDSLVFHLLDDRFEQKSRRLEMGGLLLVLLS